MHPPCELISNKKGINNEMTNIRTVNAPKGVDYSAAPQRSPEWLALHVGRVGASDLYRWMAVSKRDGKPLKSRSDLEREIAFGKTFNVPFSKYMTGAMQAGIDNEDFVRDQYSSALGVAVSPAGAFYDKWSVASPDGLIGEDGGCEIKWLQDTNWTEVAVTNAVIDSHYYQIQGNLRLSGRKWWDYVAANPNTGRFIVIRVNRDEELIKDITKSVKEVEKVEKLKPEHIFEFTASVPQPVISEGENPWG